MLHCQAEKFNFSYRTDQSTELSSNGLERMREMTRKVGVIGTGHVGAHVMFAMAAYGVCDELVVTDINQQKAESEAQDIFDTISLLPKRVRVSAGTYEDLADCDIVVNAAGKVDLLIGSVDRGLETEFTINAVHTWVDRLRKAGFNGRLINISNPCDVVTREIALGLGLPEGHVFGTGTGLDTARLKSQLAEQTGLDHKSIIAFMLGEHGNSMFCPWSCVYISGKPFSQLDKSDPRFDFEPEELEKRARMGGWKTFAGKHCTEYAIASTAARMAEAVFNDSKMIMPASRELHGEYGVEGVFAGVPCVIGKDGAEEVLDLHLTPEEQKKFDDSIAAIRENMAKADSMFPVKQN